MRRDVEGLEKLRAILAQQPLPADVVARCKAVEDEYAGAFRYGVGVE